MIELPDEILDKLSQDEKAIYFCLHKKKDKLASLSECKFNIPAILASYINALKPDVLVDLLNRAIISYHHSPTSSPFLIRNLLDNGVDANIIGQTHRYLPIESCINFHSPDKSIQLIAILMDYGAEIFKKTDCGTLIIPLIEQLNTILERDMSIKDNPKFCQIYDYFYSREFILRCINIQIKHLINFKDNIHSKCPQASTFTAKYCNKLSKISHYLLSYPCQTNDDIKSLLNICKTLFSIKLDMKNSFKYDDANNILFKLSCIKCCIKHREPVLSAPIQQALESSVVHHSSIPNTKQRHFLDFIPSPPM